MSLLSKVSDDDAFVAKREFLMIRFITFIEFSFFLYPHDMLSVAVLNGEKKFYHSWICFQMKFLLCCSNPLSTQSSKNIFFWHRQILYCCDFLISCELAMAAFAPEEKCKLCVDCTQVLWFHGIIDCLSRFEMSSQGSFHILPRYGWVVGGGREQKPTLSYVGFEVGKGGAAVYYGRLREGGWGLRIAKKNTT